MKSVGAAIALLAANLGSVPADAAAGGGQVPNSVRCVYDSMSEESKEITLLILNEELGTDTFLQDPSKTQELNTLMEEAHNHCVDLYPWTSGKSANAISFAIAGLIRDAIAQVIRHDGRDPASIEGWFDENKAVLGRLTKLDESRLAPLMTRLQLAGWSTGDANQAGIAKTYAQLLWEQERYRQGFIAGVFFENIRPPRRR